MDDRYTAPAAAVDDGVRERGARRNAAIAFAAGLATECAVVLILNGGDLDRVNYRWLALWVLVLPPSIVATVAAVLPRLRWYLVVVLAPVPTLVLMVSAIAIVQRWLPGQ